VTLGRAIGIASGHISGLFVDPGCGLGSLGELRNSGLDRRPGGLTDGAVRETVAADPSGLALLLVLHNPISKACMMIDKALLLSTSEDDEE